MRFWLSSALVVAACGGARAPAADPRPTSAELRAPEDFAAIGDPGERSRALFGEAARVMMHARCTNCHPVDDSPRQRDGEMHDPPVTRGDDDRGVPAMRCAACHQDANLEMARVPGAPEWHLAPRVAAWQGKSAGEICAQLKDRARNGGRSLDQIADHAAHDKLVAWGWSPGHGRAPAPGSQARFAVLVRAWIDNGAACPNDEVKR